MNRCSVLRGGICGKNYKGNKEAPNNSILEFISMASRQAPLNKAEVPKHSGGVAAYLQGGFHFKEFDDVFVAGHGVLVTQRDQFAAIILLE